MFDIPVFHRQWAMAVKPSPTAVPAVLKPNDAHCLIADVTAVPQLKLSHLIEVGSLLHIHSPYEDHVYRHPKTGEVIGTSALASAIEGFWGMEGLEEGFSPSGAVCRLSRLLGQPLGHVSLRSACGKHDVFLLAYIRYLERRLYWSREQIAEWLKSQNF